VAATKDAQQHAQQHKDAAGPLRVEEVLAEEAYAIHGDAAGKRIRDKVPPSDPAGSVDGAAQAAFYRELNALNSAALCLSGGGIRSASFALGVIQALATHPRPPDAPHDHVDSDGRSLLARFHYLSTVSGGGYIGGWLSAWISRAKEFKPVWESLVRRPAGPDVEPATLAWLRTYSNYLTPRIGAMSADTWTAAAIVGRNLFLNWLVILPLLVGVLLLLKFYAGAVDWLSWANRDVCTMSFSNPRLSDAIGVIGIVLLLVALSVRSYHMPSRGHSTLTQWEFLCYDLVPTALAALFFVWALATPCLHNVLADNTIRLFSGSPALIWCGLIGGAALYLLSWVLGRGRYAGFADFRRSLIGWLAAGAIFGVLMAIGVSLATQLWTTTLVTEWGTAEIILLIGGVPWVLMSQLVAEIILVGLTSGVNGSDSDREWLGRVAGWMLVVAVGWLALMTLVFLGSGWIEALSRKGGYSLQTLLLPVGGLSGLATALLGKSSMSRNTGETGKPPSGFQISMDVALIISAIVFAMALVIVTSGLIDQMLFGQSFIDFLRGSAEQLRQWREQGLADVVTGYAPVPIEARYGVIALAVTAFIGWVASRYVNINRFSLHALYRNRLVRAFLGGSNPEREKTRNPFTGFDDSDNVRVWTLWPALGQRSKGWMPFHVINIALNIVSSRKLAWQERKAEPFTVSPLHSGSAYKAYRSSREYGHLGEGISLGTAMAISGAAASPNMGYHSAPSITFLMALLNVRLGWWLGNPGEEGSQTYRREGPSFAIRPLLSEMFGLTTDTNRYIYLSDGGHFENLGLYEMVRRRCRLIVVSDAGCDRKFEFDDLGNAVRKIALDLGIRISFEGIENLSIRCPNKNGNGVPYHAIGTIHYHEADGGEDGVILYIKPAYHGIENIGIRSYAAANQDFPHESTGDQFFSESQFESYRALGFEVTDSVLKTVFEANPPTAWTVAGMIAALKPLKSGDQAGKTV
jgi:Patatin-like phospholipase